MWVLLFGCEIPAAKRFIPVKKDDALRLPGARGGEGFWLENYEGIRARNR
jgi:hypothetical protein